MPTHGMKRHTTKWPAWQLMLWTAIGCQQILFVQILGGCLTHGAAAAAGEVATNAMPTADAMAMRGVVVAGDIPQPAAAIYHNVPPRPSMGPLLTTMVDSKQQQQQTPLLQSETFFNGAAVLPQVAATATPTTTTTSAMNTRNNFEGFSALDKEVVERLIKRWAPVVWLAPEEKFMPLGVEEFLHHVHPMDKGKTLISAGMPIGDTSTKAYLVTNAEIDDLLENEDSFIYGRNPNDAPVPIYAVVSLCNNGRAAFANANDMQQQQQQQPHDSVPPTTPTKLPYYPATPRNPYIPVSLDPLDERNHTQRRSSRFYPAFKRVQRHAAGTPHDATPPPSPPTQLPNESAAVNNFIANLADNVKFSGNSAGPAMSAAVDDNAASAVNDPPDTDYLDNQINTRYEAAPQSDATLSHDKFTAFHVTYWMFYPYSQGKTMCTLNLGPLGSIPFPAVYGFCLGRRKDIGSHIGDWEHMSLYFNGDGVEPEAMYVSAHDAGAYYTYNRLTGSFEFKKQETRKGILQRPNFPKTVTTFHNHPVLFAAKGSHGLWTAPGKHRFVKVARLYDVNGFGTPWNTWKSVDISYENLKSYGRSLMPAWLSFKGKWGNPKSRCHPFRRIGLNFCEFTDGPTGIPLKEPHFQCSAGATHTYRR